MGVSEKAVTSQRDRKGRSIQGTHAPAGPVDWLRRFLEMDEPRATTRKIEWGLYAAACLTLLYFHVVLFRHSGAFWRDETNTIQLASAADWGTVWNWLAKDTAPLMIHALLRTWMTTEYGATLDGLRLMGILISLGIVVSLTISCRLVTGRLPLLALSVVAFNASIFYYCSSIRAYGIAVLFILPCYAAFWRLASRPTPWNAAASLLFALLSCQAGYLNAYLLLGIGMGAAGVSALSRHWSRAALILAICFLAALSLLPYIPALHEYEDACKITKIDLRLGTVFDNFCMALSGESAALGFLWIVLLTCCFARLASQLSRAGGALLDAPSLPLYLAIAVGVSLAAGVVFFLSHAYYPSPWHYSPFVAMAGIFVELALSSGSKDRRLWTWCLRMAAAAVIVVVSLPEISASARLRRTNLDLASRIVADEAASGDFILVNPFWLAPGFKYYYQGKAEWNTLPPTSSEMEVCLFPYPAMKDAMARPHAIDPALRKIEETLSSGGRLWVVGDMAFLPPNMAPPSLSAAPDPQFGWNNIVYSRVWMLQVGRFLETHAMKGRQVPVEVDHPVSPLENVSVYCFEGWRNR